MNNKLYFYRMLMWCMQKLWRHMAAYENAMCHTRVHVRACACARVCACVRVCAHVCVINDNKHPFH